jgi:NAD(P)-dependent dehydrogenase (short-subunit alcohol dehydrogenase family)
MAVALITGCSSGFGLEAAVAFAQAGDTVVATMRNLGKADALRKRAADAGVDVDLEALDVTSDDSVANAVAAVLARHGRIDVLVNNAGVGYGGAVETMPMDAARELFETNFWGALRMMRAVLPGMRERRDGAIVNVSSVAGRLPGTLYEGMYATSKHALGAISEALAGETEPFGIRVVCIEPGFFETAIAHNSDAVDQGTKGSPYEADAAWFKSFMDQSVAGGADPRVVADAIVAAAHDPAPPLHQPIGDDAQGYLALLESAGSFEGWLEAAVPIVESVAGPRPPASG